MTPRTAIREVLAELPELRRALVSKAQRPAVEALNRWERLLRYALEQHGTGETAGVVDDAG